MLIWKTSSQMSRVRGVNVTLQATLDVFPQGDTLEPFIVHDA